MEKRVLIIKLLIIVAPVVIALTVSGLRKEGTGMMLGKTGVEASAAEDRAADTGEAERASVSAASEDTSDTADITGTADTADTGFLHLQLRLDEETYRFPVCGV